jgi:hypothetical protein
MKIRYVESSSGVHQGAQAKAQSFELEEFIIGRGGKSTLIIPHRALSLEHACFWQSAQGLHVKDLGSLGGVQLNGALIREAIVHNKDVLSLAGFELTIYDDAGTWILHHDKKSEEPVSQTTSLERLSIWSYVPSIPRLSLFLVGLILLFYVLLPLFSKRAIEPHSVGELSKNHAFLAHDCASCHTNAFEPASDAGCLSCHAVTSHYDPNQTKHAAFAPHHRTGTGNCVSCHTEHKGHVTYDDNRLCTSCHATIEQTSPAAQLKNVSDWLAHPAFSTPKDTGDVKLNHAVHLKAGLRGDKGPETLTCASCHMPDEQGAGMKPISFETNCARCHSLEFDERLPGKSVPHGDPERVIEYLSEVYARAALDQKKTAPQGDDARLIPVPNQAELTFDQRSVTKQVNDTAHILFTKTGCALCHTVSEKASSVAQGLMSYDIQKGAIPESWYKKASFSHDKHSHLDCVSCHKDVQNSKQSRDVLMPEKKDCLECHAQAPALSACSTCHNFHDSNYLNLMKLPHTLKESVR